MLDSQALMINPNTLIVTEDGSFSLVEPVLNEGYHNRAGAYTESLQQYTLPLEVGGLLHKLSQSSSPFQPVVRWVDVCFGLGYNTFTTLQQLLLKPVAIEGLTVDVVAFENDKALIPLWSTILRQPCYEGLLDPLAVAVEAHSHALSSLNADRFCVEVPLSTLAGETVTVRLVVVFGDLRQTIPVERDANPVLAMEGVDAVFHDAFSPAKVPWLWDVDLFEVYAQWVAPRQGKVLTYSLARLVKTALEQTGFSWQKTSPLGKKHGGLVAQLEASL
jgi:tRNA U34 5-methylaminomethyl-2-thiouridine-forming methyltransferase MnmC